MESPWLKSSTRGTFGKKSLVVHVELAVDAVDVEFAAVVPFRTQVIGQDFVPDPAWIPLTLPVAAVGLATMDTEGSVDHACAFEDCAQRPHHGAIVDVGLGRG